MSTCISCDSAHLSAGSSRASASDLRRLRERYDSTAVRNNPTYLENPTDIDVCVAALCSHTHTHTRLFKALWKSDFLKFRVIASRFSRKRITLKLNPDWLLVSRGSGLQNKEAYCFWSFQSPHMLLSFCSEHSNFSCTLAQKFILGLAPKLSSISNELHQQLPLRINGHMMKIMCSLFPQNTLRFIFILTQKNLEKVKIRHGCRFLLVNIGEEALFEAALAARRSLLCLCR